MFLAADIGGTKSLLGMFEADNGSLRTIRTAELHTADAGSPADLIREFVGSERPTAMSVAVAGAIVEGSAKGSNLPWVVQERDLTAAFGCPVTMLNDLQAIAYYVPRAPADELDVLQAGSPVAEGPIGVIAPGTGIGAAMLFAGPDGYRSHPSETGHIDFASTDTRQDAWLAHLRGLHGRVSLERACSGRSMRPMYEFMCGHGDAEPDPVTRGAIESASDAGPVITRAGLEARCPVCAATLEMFVDILAAAAGNLALQILARGGIVLAGGIPPRILPLLHRDRFLEAFNNKGRFEHLTRQTPVSILLNPSAGLLGAAWFHVRYPTG